MKTTAKSILAKMVGAGLLAGAVAIAVPSAQAQYGYGNYNSYNNGYYANSYDRGDRFHDRDDWKRRRDWERQQERERRRFEHEQRERMKHGYYGYNSYGWR